MQHPSHRRIYPICISGQYIAAGYYTCTQVIHKSQLPTMWRCGAEQLGFKCLKSFVSEPVLYPTQIDHLNDEDKLVVPSNTSRRELCTPSINIGRPRIPCTHAVADTGTASVLLMANTPMKNVQIAPNPCSIQKWYTPRTYVMSKYQTYRMCSRGTLSWPSMLPP